MVTLLREHFDERAVDAADIDRRGSDPDCRCGCRPRCRATPAIASSHGSKRVRLARLRALHGAELALPDQAFAKVGKERQVVGAKEAGEANSSSLGAAFHSSFAARDRGVRLVYLARVDGVVRPARRIPPEQDSPRASRPSSQWLNSVISCLPGSKTRSAFHLNCLRCSRRQHQAVAVVGFEGQPFLLRGIGGREVQRSDRRRDSRR